MSGPLPQKPRTRVAIMADLPGPKMRIGEFAEEPIELKPEMPST